MVNVVEIGMQGPRGAPGATGHDGLSFYGAYVANQNLLAGQPICISRANGKAILADASVYTSSFVVGCAETNANVGFPVGVIAGRLELPNWTSVAGQQFLTPGVPYFLKAGGGITVTAPQRPACAASVMVGVAASPTTLAIAPYRPFLL